jgi:hypothetical protein
MPHLLHFSEDPHITIFHPHVPASSPDNPPMVWAVDEEHAPGFWFPRDAPRACCWGAHRRMHAIETVWLERMRACQLFVYRFERAPFAIHNNDAGYFSTRKSIRPLSVEPVGDLLSRHVSAAIELRIVPNLWPVIDSIVASGLQFSIIRKMNALPRGAN